MPSSSVLLFNGVRLPAVRGSGCCFQLSSARQRNCLAGADEHGSVLKGVHLHSGDVGISSEFY